MEHPLLQVDPSLSADQLQTTISDLNKKLTFAMRTGNAHLANQIRMAIESYSNRYKERVQEAYASASKSGTDFSDKINIT